MKKIIFIILTTVILLSSVSAFAQETIYLNETKVAGVARLNEIEDVREIRGTIYVPEFFEGEVAVYIEGDYAETDEIIINAPGEYPYTLVVNKYADEEYPVLYFSSDYENRSNCYMGALYYTENGSVYNYDCAERVALTGNITTGVDFNLIEGKNISGSISLGADGYIDSGKVNVIVSCYNDEFFNSDRITMLSANTVFYNVSVPNEVDECCWEIYAYFRDDCDTNIVEGTYYFSEKGITSNPSDEYLFNVEKDTVYNVELPTCGIVKIQVKLPNDVTGELNGIYASIENTETGEEINREVTLDKEGCFRLPVEEAGSYIICVEPEAGTESNILVNTYYYVSDTETAEHYNEAASVYLDGENDFIVICLKTKRVLSGNIIVPDGIAVYEYEDQVDISLITEDSSHTKTISLTGKENPFEFELDENYEGSVNLSYTYHGDEPQLYKGTLYYTENGAKLNIADEDVISLTKGEKLTGVKLELPKNKATIDFVARRSELSKPNGAVNAQIYVYTKTDEPTLISTIYISTNAYNTKATLNIPDLIQYRDDDAFCVEYAAYSGFSGKQYSGRFITNDGKGTFDEKKAALYNWNTETIEFVIEDLSTVTKDAVKSKLVTFSANESNMDEDSLTICAEPSDFEKMRKYLIKAMCCEYDEEGCLVNVIRCDIDGYFGAVTGMLFFDFAYNEKHTYKIFLWDAEGTLIPMAEAFEIIKSPN